MGPCSACFVILHLRRVVKPLDICAAEIESMLALCNVVDLIMLSMRGLCKPPMLKDAINDHLHLAKVAYADTLWRPKTHFATHLPGQLERHGFLPCCFVQERKHRVVKRAALHRHNSLAFDRGVLEEVTLQQLHDLNTCLHSDVLRNTSAANAQLLVALRRGGEATEADVTVGTEAVVSSRAISVGDVALLLLSDLRPGIGEVFSMLT